ncbi:MAG TPA: ABC transporter ATP-binding protein [Ruania sp.]|nr:ABC transporter ATP-binding protein [Ruania sp.]
MMTEPLIQISGVTKVFDHGGQSVYALKDVDLSIGEGEFVTIVGPSGCGKSTMLNLLGGLDFPSSGLVSVDGHPVTAPGPDRGVIFQQYALFPWLTVRKNVEFGLRVAGVPRQQRRELAMQSLRLVDLEDFADSLPKTLSGGMKQRCAIARAYAVSPELLLMDEPFGALDALTRVRMQSSLLDTWQRERKTVVFITHDVDEAVFLADRVVVMGPRPGHIVKVIDVDLPRPRDERVRDSEQFQQVRSVVWNDVYYHEEQKEKS